MMTLRFQIIIAIIVICGLIYLVNLIRRNRLELKYALSWIIVGVLVLICDCFPNVINYFSGILGIATPVNMLFFLGFIFVAMIILTLTVALSIASSSVKRLTQKIALLDKRIKELEEKNKVEK